MDWKAAQERLKAPMFAPLRSAIDRLPADRWPGHLDLTEAVRGVTTSQQKPLRFVAPRDHTDRERSHYELRIAETGEVETRPENWHDLFNALVWLAFPRAKAAINAQHASILEERGDSEAKRRGPERDALTLFDEGGVVVLSSDPALFGLIVEFEWKDLFWHRRGELEEKMRFLAFGHALYEKALEPHLGIVAKTVFLETDRAPAALAQGEIDTRLARHFADRERFPSPKAMAPMPVLGIPCWHPQTGSEAFYDDASHFRGRAG